MALARCVVRSLSQNNNGGLSIVFVQSSKYSTKNEKVNIAGYKRGTGGRSSFSGMVTTIFGPTGFVGSYVCNKFGKIGSQLILPYRGDHYELMPLKLAGDLGQVLFYNFDLRDQKSVETAVKHSNVVVNLIGRDHETMNYKFHDVNAEGARTIARACKKMGVDRLIHLSYLNSAEHPVPLAMKKPSEFKKSKWYGEQYVMEEFPDATIIKASDIYGNEDRFINHLAWEWRRQIKIMPLWKNGDFTEKQPVYVSDVAQGIVNAAKDPSTKGQIYQAVGPKRYKMGDLVDFLYTHMRRDASWGYMRYDMKYDPIFKLRVTLHTHLSPAYPIGGLSWEIMELQATSDDVKPGVPTLEDLGVPLTCAEIQMPYECRKHRVFGHYKEELREFVPPVLNTVPI